MNNLLDTAPQKAHAKFTRQRKNSNIVFMRCHIQYIQESQQHEKMNPDDSSPTQANGLFSNTIDDQRPDTHQSRLRRMAPSFPALQTFISRPHSELRT
jgi:hypothetical protein